MQVCDWLKLWSMLVDCTHAICCEKCEVPTRVKRCRSKAPSYHTGRPTCHGVLPSARALHCVNALRTTAATCLLRISADCTVLPSAWALHRADALRTHVRTVNDDEALRARLDQRITTRQFNNLHYTALYDFKTLINTVCVFYCDCHYKQSHTS
jgi:hypothetical protein